MLHLKYEYCSVIDYFLYIKTHPFFYFSLSSADELFLNVDLSVYIFLYSKHFLIDQILCIKILVNI